MSYYDDADYYGPALRRMQSDLARLRRERANEPGWLQNDELDDAIAGHEQAIDDFGDEL